MQREFTAEAAPATADAAAALAAAKALRAQSAQKRLYLRNAFAPTNAPTCAPPPVSARHRDHDALPETGLDYASREIEGWAHECWVWAKLSERVRVGGTKFLQTVRRPDSCKDEFRRLAQERCR
jgi:hypothetical protein